VNANLSLMDVKPLSEKEIRNLWYLSYMIVKHRRQCEVYSGTSSGKSSEAMYCFRCRDPF